MKTITAIRTATIEDAENIARLCLQLGYPVTTKIMRKRLLVVLGQEAHLVIVAECADGGFSGWLHAFGTNAIESGFCVEIAGLVVAENMRRKGMGKRLVAYAENWAKKQKAAILTVRSNVKRLESHEFYPALGYVAVKTQIVYRKHLVADQNPARRKRDTAGERAPRGNWEKFDRAMAKVRDVPPLPGDEK